MPRDSSGNYSLPSGVNPVITGTTVASTWANTTMNDLATEMTDSLSRSGKGGMIAAFKVADGALSTPGLAFANESNTGLYRSGTGTMQVVITGTSVATITNTTWTMPSISATGTISATGGFTGNLTGNVTGTATSAATATTASDVVPNTNSANQNQWLLFNTGTSGAHIGNNSNFIVNPSTGVLTAPFFNAVL